MLTKTSLVACVAVALTVAMTSDAFAGGKRPGTRHSRPIFASSRSCCVAVDACAPAVAAPTATAAAPGTYRSFSYEPSAPAPVYRAPAAPSRTPSYMLPKTDPRRYGGGW